MNAILSISELNFHYGNQIILKDFSFEIQGGDLWMLGGPSGSGKTTLARIISGELTNYEGEINFSFSSSNFLKPAVAYVANWYQFSNLEGDRNFYYQQRYNQFAKDDTKSVLAELNYYADEQNLDFQEINSLLERLGFEHVLGQQLIELSSGEHKKLQLIKALWLKPQLLVIDQPYTGLDRISRSHLNQIIQDLNEEGMTFLLINNDEDYPDSVHHFGEIIDGKLVEVNSAEALSKGEKRIPKTLPYFLQQNPNPDAAHLIKMNRVSVSYGEKKVLDNINWEVQPGERWLLQGHNGSGKSTLLSLLNGDHPQAYANEIFLFGNRRGSGESIWDLKERIGMISPELHWYFDTNANVGQTIASGFFDSMSLYQKLSYDQQQKLEQVLFFFDLKEDKNMKLNTLSLGKQRLVLLARTLIKNPELLILDEPTQGLDVEQTRYFNQVIDDLSKNGMTLLYVGHFENQLPNCITHRLVLEKGQPIALGKLENEVI